MIKGALILLNIIFLAILNFFVLQKISITQELPEKLAPGQSTQVNVAISKGKVTGFAKFQINVDPGLVIEAIETSGASFTFQDQKAKFIWMALPETPKVNITYRIIARPDADGLKKVEGHFSYIDDNQRLVHDLPEAHIATGSAEPIAKKDQPVNGKATAFVHREIKPGTGGRYTVELTIHKSNLGGFAKLQEEIPADYTAVAIERADAVFNMVGTQVKFVWFDIADRPEIKLSYEMIPVHEPAVPNFNISGEFSFLSDNETRTVTVGEIPFEKPETEPELVAEENSGMENEPEIVQEPEPAIRLETEASDAWDSGTLRDDEPELADVPQPVYAPEPIPEPEPSPAPTEATVPQPAPDPIPAPQPTEPSPKSKGLPAAPSTLPETAITYKIQITAARKVVDAQYFADRHKFRDSFGIENHEGWVKYTTGGFSQYKDARNHREKLKASHNFPGPFVTAYNDGARITVQEALMISNQRWTP